MTQRHNKSFAFSATLLLLAAAGFAVDPPRPATRSAPPQALMQPDEPMDDEPTISGPAEPILRKLSDDEVHRIRYMELRPLRLNTDQPDRVRVKIPQDTVDEFLLDMEGHEDFEGEKTRRQFRAMTPPQKLHFIAKYKGDAYIDKLQILTDPEVFVQFRRNVMPVVWRGCATTGCHAPNFTPDVKFGLYKDPKRSPSTTYANYVILNDLVANDLPLINRGHPGDSLLLTYMLPIKDVKPAMRHPGDPLNPIYQARSATGFRRIEKWIGSLRQPPPDYGVHLIPTQPGLPPETLPNDQPPQEKPADGGPNSSQP